MRDAIAKSLQDERQQRGLGYSKQMSIDHAHRDQFGPAVEKKLEHELTAVQRRRFAQIFKQVGPKAEKHWRKVMALLSEQIEF